MLFISMSNKSPKKLGDDRPDMTIAVYLDVKQQQHELKLAQTFTRCHCDFYGCEYKKFCR